MYGSETDFNALLSYLKDKEGKVSTYHGKALTEAQGKALYANGWMCGGTGEFWKVKTPNV